MIKLPVSIENLEECLMNIIYPDQRNIQFDLEKIHDSDLLEVMEKDKIRVRSRQKQIILGYDK